MDYVGAIYPAAKSNRRNIFFAGEYCPKGFEKIKRGRDLFQAAFRFKPIPIIKSRIFGYCVWGDISFLAEVGEFVEMGECGALFYMGGLLI